MENCVEYANSNSIQVELNDECNDDTGSETSDTFTAFSSLIQNDNRTNTDTTHRRVVKYMGKPKFLIKYDNQQIFSSQKSTRYNKSVKRFLFLFGLATMLIILSQIYLSVDIDGTTFGCRLKKILIETTKKKIKKNTTFTQNMFHLNSFNYWMGS